MTTASSIRFFTLLFILVQTEIYSLQIKYEYKPGSKFKVEATIEGEQHINNVEPFPYQQYYKTMTSVLELDESGIALLQDDGYYYINNTREINPIREIRENILVKYHKDANGLIFAPADSPFPVMRNIPFLPETEVHPGSKWQSEGLEMQDFFGDHSISQLPVKVDYEFLGVDTDLLQTARISYLCNVNVKNNGTGVIDSRIYRVTGTSNNMLYFSLKEKRPIKETYQRDYQIITSDNCDFRFTDHGERIWSEVQNTINKEKEISRIAKDIRKQDLKDVNITDSGEGLKLSLENIQFEPDCDRLTKEEAARLEEIAKILTKYKDKHIRIVGHTADRGTPEEQQKLSSLRAKAVSQELLRYHAITPSHTEIQGKGATEPIASNRSEDGRKKNRRVEIYITDE